MRPSYGSFRSTRNRKGEREDRAMTQLARHSDGSLVSRHNRLRDRQAHPGATHKIALIFPAIDFVEYHALLEIVDARTAVSHTCGHVVPVQFGSDRDRLLFWRIQVGIVDELHQNVLGTVGISLHKGKIRSYFHLNLPGPQ